MSKRILLIEDDEMTSKSIRDQVRRACQPALIPVEFEFVSTEHHAMNLVDSMGADNKFDIYIIDLMLPWAWGDNIEMPEDPRVIKDGALRAGFRVAEGIRKKEGADISKWRPMILYTVATIAAEMVGNGHQQHYRYERIQKTDDEDKELADRVRDLLSSGQVATARS